MEKFFDGISGKQPGAQRNGAVEQELPIGEEVMMPLEGWEASSVVSIKDQRGSGRASIISKQGKKIKIVWDKVSRACLYLLFGLMPFFFLPFGAFPVDDTKNILIAICVLLAAAAWLAKVLAVGRIEIPQTKLWLFALAFLVAVGVSTALSLSSSVSVWGNNFQPDSLFPLLFSFIALFVASVVFTDSGHIKKAQILLAGSSILVAASSLLQFFGKYILFFDFTKTQSFTAFGSLTDVGVFLGLGFLVVIAAISAFALQPVKRIALIVGALVIASTLLVLDPRYIWLGLMLGFALAASWQMVEGIALQRSGQDKERNGRYAHSQFGLFMVLMILCAILFFVGSPLSRIISLPATVTPSFFTTLGIGKDMLHEGLGRAVFGSGPGTFLYEYLIHRPDAINATSFFAVRFLQGFSLISTLFVSLGILGILGILGFLGYFLWLAFRGISRMNKNFKDLGGNLVSFLGFVFLIFMWFLYPLSIPLVVLTFLFGGLLIAGLRNEGIVRQMQISFAQSIQSVFIFSFAVIILLTGLTIGAYWQAQHYAAAVIAAKGVQGYNTANGSGSAADDATSKLGLAISLDGSNDLYLRTLSQLFTARAANLLQKNSGSQDASVLQQNFQQQFQSAIQAASLSIAINDRDPLNWQALGDVYASFLNIVGGSDTFALQNYQKMVAHDPKDPSVYLVLAQAYVSASDAIQTKIANAAGSQQQAAQTQSQTQQWKTQSSDYLAKAQDTLKQGVSLKGDYAPALYLMAQVYDRQGNRAQAIASAKQALAINPEDVGINYELGLLYYFDNQFNLSQAPLERAVALNPNYSNARYFLGIVYAKANQMQKAIDQFQEIQKLNPDNVQVKQIIANLQAGKDPLDGLTGSTQQTQAPVPQTGGAQPPTPLKKK